ncbi:MAG: Rieske 2Fe-2S domain-containing protein, partial [Actinomycetia bacterium]|nr:Rieske 2Fe-2S domain-containing protein [Actinomycetes bacterium]
MTSSRGAARSNGPAYATVVETDRTSPPPPLMEEAYQWIEGDRIDVARYTSQAFHDAEAANLWPRSWQMACRLEHIPNVGDYHVYEICDLSIIVIRTGPEEVKAFHNSCLHRGMTLV